MKRIIVLVSGIFFLLYGCVKDTYNMDKLSEKTQISPDLAAAAVSGRVTFSELVKQSDTVIYDNDKFARLLFREDSVINLALKDIYNLENMVAYNHDYVLGELSIASFQSSVSYTLDEISRSLSSTIRNELVAHDGGSWPYPSFGSSPVVLGSKQYVFANFAQATFSSGTIDIIVTNNLPVPLSGLTVNLTRATDNVSVFGSIAIPSVPASQSKIVTLGLAGKSLSNALNASVSLTQNTGSASNVLISLSNSNVQVKVAGNNLKVSSGRVILPTQSVAANDTRDTLTLDPGTGIELERIKINSGTMTYKLSTTLNLGGSLNITLPSIDMSGTPLTKTFAVSPGTGTQGSITMNNAILVLTGDADQPFNRVPMQYGLQISSNNSLVQVSSTDKVHLELRLPNPDFDYVKGYFGQEVQNLANESVNLGIDDIVNKLTGQFLISNPIIRLKYTNSFAIPIQVALNGEGIRGSTSVSLGLAPFQISSPQSLTAREASGTIVIDRNNSSLPQLISLPPARLNFSGSVKMNPSGDPSHLRNNYIFGNSRFLGNLEVEVPLEFRLANLQLSDTLDNFLEESDNFGGFSKMQLVLTAKNGFPLGASINLTVRNSTSGAKKSINIAPLLSPAPVDVSGKATGTSDSKVTIELTSEFLDFAKAADQLILSFTLVTTGDGTKDVKIYSDYGIDFSAAVMVKPEIEF